MWPDQSIYAQKLRVSNLAARIIDFVVAVIEFGERVYDFVVAVRDSAARVSGVAVLVRQVKVPVRQMQVAICGCKWGFAVFGCGIGTFDRFTPLFEGVLTILVERESPKPLDKFIDRRKRPGVSSRTANPIGLLGVSAGCNLSCKS